MHDTIAQLTTVARAEEALHAGVVVLTDITEEGIVHIPYTRNVHLGYPVAAPEAWLEDGLEGEGCEPESWYDDTGEAGEIAALNLLSGEIESLALSHFQGAVYRIAEVADEDWTPPGVESACMADSGEAAEYLGLCGEWPQTRLRFRAPDGAAVAVDAFGFDAEGRQRIAFDHGLAHQAGVLVIGPACGPHFIEAALYERLTEAGVAPEEPALLFAAEHLVSAEGERRIVIESAEPRRVA